MVVIVAFVLCIFPMNNNNTMTTVCNLRLSAHCNHIPFLHIRQSLLLFMCSCRDFSFSRSSIYTSISIDIWDHLTISMKCVCFFFHLSISNVDFMMNTLYRNSFVFRNNTKCTYNYGRKKKSSSSETFTEDVRFSFKRYTSILIVFHRWPHAI